ncbi:HEAT repeat domain-containing protein [Streptomyces sp. NBC_01725]|uniref:HEAT repeat domain-containing protein n=1 Tax=Streptomyces sp. NBC_01725 TaxID=2975923 RepID=UPI002E27D7A5|nr:HEAT repeat domain-containing protein [Streptomyces sp. NBC_01725]
MTPGDEAFENAFRRADVGRLAGLVDPVGCPPGVLERLLRHEDPRVRSLGLVSLGERVAVVGGRADACEQLAAALLPMAMSAAGHAAWSTQDTLVLAELFARLGPHAPKPYALADRVPSRRTAGLPVRVRIAWLRAEIANDPTHLRREPASEALYQAVRDTDIAAACRPRQLVAELLESGDQVLAGQSLRLAREGLHAGTLAVGLVRAHLVRLLDLDAEHALGSATVVAALTELSEPWATLEPLPPHRVSGLLTAAEATVRPEVAEAALTALARHGHSDDLRQIVGDPDLPPRLRRRALELLGALATRDDIRELTALAARDPLLFGEPAVTCLRGLHRRGHFVTAPDVPAVVALALVDHAIAPCEIATILFTCRQEMFRLLTDATADDPSWPRRLALLVALAGQGTGDAGEPGELPVGDVITRTLKATSAPRPFLDALRALRHTAAEEAVLARLAAEPATVLRTLEAIGGRRTVSALRDGLGLAAADGEGVIAPHLPPGTVAPQLRAVRHRALELLWQLTEDPADRRALLVRLDPAELPARIAADLGGPDEGELALLGARANLDEPVAALCGLAAHGGAGTLPVIADLLLRVVAELALPEGTSTARPPSRRSGGSGTGQGPSGEPVVPGEVLEAVRDLGRRLHARRRIRPVCLLDAADAEAAGNALAATMVLDLLERPGQSDGERVILLELLTRIPYPHIRPRVHRLLRHRNPHLRRHVIALLARDSDGADAQALSASLITLTAADDTRTVRQALLALGHARARWAAGAIAACLDHPNMNIKKTAAGALVHAGTAVAVPRLLNWLGRHDNPGFRTALADALRAILGDAYEATLRAAVDGTDEPRARRLLRACLAERPPESAAPSHRSDIAALESGGWRPAIALRIARRGELPARHRPHSLRPTLADWLALADRTRDPAQTPTGDPAPDWFSDTRTRLVRTALRLCPPPLSEAERRTYARSTPLLRMCLAEAATWDDDGQDLVTVLEELAPTLPTVEKRAVADAVRALPGTAPAPTLTLLRRCGAVLTRADLDQALEAAATGWSTAARAERVAPAEVAVLREAFGITDVPLPADTRAWRVQLAAAVRGPSEAAKFRRAEESRQGASRPNSRHALAALADTYSAADPVTRSVLLDWMTALQPLDAPPWTLGEAAADDAASAAAPSRTVRTGDLDQPRSAALRARLLDMLDAPDPDRRRTAATALLKWPDPDVRSAVLRAYLHGRVDLGVHIPADIEPPGLLAALADTGGAEISYERLARLAVRLDPSVLQPLVPRLLEWWQQAPQAVRPVLDAVPADTLAVILGDRMEAGAWGYLDLLAGRTLLRTPALTEIRRRLRAEGREALAESLRLVDGPLRDPGAERDDAHERARSTAPPRASDGPSRQESLRLARTGSPDQIRRALNRLAEEHPGPQDPTSREAPDDPELRALIDELLHHPRPRVRLHAHRTSRSLFDRETYLRHTSTLLGDAQPDVVRSAVRTLTHAAWEPAVPAVVALLDHPHPAVRAAAVDGLAHLGGRAVPALRRAADHARPDKRSAYTAVLDRITATQTDQTRDSAGKPVQRSSAGRWPMSL